MSWYRDDDGKIITDEEFEDCCCNCSAFCSEGAITVPCNGERTDCPYFKEVDTSEYDKEIRAKAIDEFAEKLKREILEEIDDASNRQKNYEVGSDMSTTYSHIMGTLRDVYHRIIDKIAEELKAGEKNG